MRGGGGDVQARADRGEHRGRSFCRQHSRPVPALPLLLHRRRCLTALCNGDVGAALPTRRNRSSAAHRVHSKEKGRKKNKKKQNQNNFLAAFSRQPEMEKTRMRPGCLHSASWMQARTRPSAAGSKGCAIEPWGCPSPPPPFPSFLSQCNLKKAKTEQKRRA